MSKNYDKNRLLIYILGCVGTKSLLTYIISKLPSHLLPIVGYIALIPIFGFSYNFLSGTRTIGAFGEKVWWNSLRPIHAILYSLFAISAINKNPHCWIILAIDIIISAIGFFIYHYIHNDHKLRQQFLSYFYT